MSVEKTKEFVEFLQLYNETLVCIENYTVVRIDFQGSCISYEIEWEWKDTSIAAKRCFAFLNGLQYVHEFDHPEVNR